MFEHFMRVQCQTDSGEVGDFIASAEDKTKPISPVFESLADLLPWMKENGWELYERDRNGKFIPFRVRKVNNGR